MNKNTAKDTAAYLIKHAKQYGFDKIDVNFHGGEPLLNFEIMRYLVSEMKSACSKNNLQFGFMFTTNGIIFNEEIVDFLKQEQPCVTLSIDGDQVTHDSQRKFHNGKGSYEQVIKTGKQLQKLDILLFARMTFNSETVAYLTDNIEFLINEDFTIIKPIPDYFDKQWTAQNYRQFAKQLQKILVLETRHEAFITLLEPFREPKRMYPCKGGIGEINVSTDGRLYPCTYVANDISFVIGNVSKGLNRLAVAAQHKASVDVERKQCSSCKYVNHCEGYRCTYVNHSLSGSLSVPSEAFCKLQHQLFAAAEYYQEVKGGEYEKK